MPSALTPPELKSAIIQNPLSLSPNTSVKTAIAAMGEARSACHLRGNPLLPSIENDQDPRSSCVLVVEEGQILGILTERDVLKMMVQGYDLTQVSLWQVMSHPVITLQDAIFSDLFLAITLLLQHGIRHLPIVNAQSQVVGLVTHESLRAAFNSLDLLQMRTVKDVMLPDVLVAIPDAPLLTLGQKMTARGVGSIVLIDSCPHQGDTQPIPVGILTEGDVIQCYHLGINLEHCSAQATMNRDVFTVRPTDLLSVVHQNMVRQGVYRAVVTGDAGELLGIITQTTLLKALNPLELCRLLNVFEQKVERLEAEKIQLLEDQAAKLRQEVADRTVALRTKAEREKVITQIANCIRNTASILEILTLCVNRARGFLNCDRVVVYQFHFETGGFITAESVGEGWSSVLGQWVEGCRHQEHNNLSFDIERPIPVNNIYHQGYSDCHIELLEHYQIKSNLLVPIRVSGQFWGLLIAHQCADFREWKAEESILLQDIAIQLAIAYQQITMEEQWQRELKERKQTEILLRESEQRFISLAKVAPVGIFRADITGQFSFVNEHYTQITGLSPAKAKGRGWQQGIHPEDRQWVTQQWQQNAEQQTAFEMEYRIQRPDQQIRWVYGQSALEKNFQGEVMGYVGTITDITARKLAENTLSNIIEGTAKTTGQAFFPALVSRLAQAVEAPYAIVTELVDEEFHTLALWANGKLQPATSYSLAHTPCEQVVQQGHFYCPKGLRAVFPQELPLGDIKAESYFGVALRDLQDNPIGNLCILDTKPIENFAAQKIINILQVFAARASAELQRKRSDEALQQLNTTLEERIEQRSQQLQRSQSQQQAFFDNASDLIQSVRLENGQFEYVNRAWHKVLGYTAEDLASLTIWDILPQKCHQRWLKLMAQLSKGDTTNHNPYEFIFLTQEQQEIVVEGSITCRWDSDQPIALQAIFRDVTKQQQYANQLQNLSKRLQLAVRSAQIGIWDWDIINNQLTWDERMYELYGYSSSQEMEALEIWHQGLHTEDDKAVHDAVTQALQREKEFEAQFRVVHPDGSIHWIQAHALVQHNAKGVPERMIGTNVDISDRKNTEAQLRKSDAHLKTAQRIGKLGSWEFILKNRQLLWSEEVYRIFGRDPSMGEPSFEELQTMFIPEDRQNHKQVVQKAIEAAQPYEIVLRFYRSNGQLVYMQGRGEPIVNAEGEVTHLVGTVLDITERELAEQQLQQTNQELARATRLKNEFLANMSHELRTPLNAILGMTEGLQETVFGQLNPQQEKAIKTIERSGSHLLELINDILDVAKIESGQLELDFSPTAIAPLCLSSLAFVKQMAFKKQIQLKTEIPTNLPLVMLDERRIRQLLINLLNNAVKFTPESGCITLSVNYVQSSAAQSVFLDSSPQNYVDFRVQDTGIGITPKHLDKLFQPFIQIDSALNRQYQGSGLGLALVKRIVDLHGGHVSVTSKVGQGSCFIVKLPVNQAQDDDLDAPISSQFFTETFLSTETVAPLILLVEDNEANISTLSNYLTAKGYRILLARNGQEAVTLTEFEKPDLILMDIQMPGMDGLEAITIIRQELQLTEIPIIALTALAMAGDRERCLAAGATDYLSKPIKLKRLVSTIQQQLSLD